MQTIHCRRLRGSRQRREPPTVALPPRQCDYWNIPLFVAVELIDHGNRNEDGDREIRSGRQFMDTFLTQVAGRLYEHYGDEISSLVVVLPNRRARLFFSDALSSLAERPLWSPRFATVDELMSEIGGIAAGDRVRLLTELFKVYHKYHPAETFDSFYHWGEMMLSDFDSVDKYLVDAKKLFANVADLKALDDPSYLEGDALEAVRRFWRNFAPGSKQSGEKAGFLTIWNTLYPIYNEFRERLSADGRAYQGMVYRVAAEALKAGGFNAAEKKKYVVVGFNALSESEKALFDHLASHHETNFFWDYDHYYVDDPAMEAGLFLRENLKRYPSRLPLDYDGRGFGCDKKITVVSAPSDSLQCKYVGEFVRQAAGQGGASPDKETAIVLTDESLLEPVLYSIPPEAEEINVTMGYPLKMTAVYSFVERLLMLQSGVREKGAGKAFYHADVSGLLSHPFLATGGSSAAGVGASELTDKQTEKLADKLVEKQLIYVEPEFFAGAGVFVREIFSIPAAGPEPFAAYLKNIIEHIPPPGDAEEDRSEYLLQKEYRLAIAEGIDKLTNSLAGSGVEVSQRIFAALLRKVLRGVTIPYEGEPLRGVQVMGILETRNIDFENLLILSLDDDNFPGNRLVSPSFIPYNLRVAYGLPVQSHHEGVYAYYFYRLLQRARNIHLVYNAVGDEMGGGEQSRYIYQLEYESPHEIARKTIGINVSLSDNQPIVVEKKGDAAAELEEYLRPDKPRTISPSALNRYLACPMRFYFTYLAGISPGKEVSEEVEASMFGSILHRAADILYAPLAGGGDPREKLKEMAGSAEVAGAVDMAIAENYGAMPEEGHGGSLRLARDIVIRYLNKKILSFDASQPVFGIEATEAKIACDFRFAPGRSARFFGIIDRLDRLPDGKLRVVDYKTGREELKFKGLEGLFSPAHSDQNPAAVQTMLYSMMAGRDRRAETAPALYYIRNLVPGEYSPSLFDASTKAPVESYAPYASQFEGAVARTLGELFDPEVPFRQTCDAKHCEYCDYTSICGRGNSR